MEGLFLLIKYATIIKTTKTAKLHSTPAMTAPPNTAAHAILMKHLRTTSTSLLTKIMYVMIARHMPLITDGYKYDKVASDNMNFPNNP